MKLFWDINETAIHSRTYVRGEYEYSFVVDKHNQLNESVRDDCFECGSIQDLHNHHVVPKSLGGSKTIKLCPKCHGKVHDRNFLTHKSLQKEGIAKAMQNGVKFGRPKVLSDQAESDFTDDVIFNGLTTKELAQKYNVSEPTARRRKKAIREFTLETLDK